MRIVIVGASGTIGQGLVAAFQQRHHDVIAVGRSKGDTTVDITNPQSVSQFFATLGAFDALIAAVGHVTFKPLTELSRQDYEQSLWDKLLGQIELVRQGLPWIADRGSFTLTSGVINREPIAMGVPAATVNGAIDAFVASAALEMPRGVRINAVSPTVVSEAWPVFGEYFPGFTPVPLATVAQAYIRSVEGLQTGRVFTVP